MWNSLLISTAVQLRKGVQCQFEAGPENRILFYKTLCKTFTHLLTIEIRKHSSESASANCKAWPIHSNTHTRTHTAVHAHNRTRLLSLPFQNPPSNINRDCSEGCATAKIYVCVRLKHKSPGTQVSSRLCLTVHACTYLLSEFRYVAMASLRAQSSSRAWWDKTRRRGVQKKRGYRKKRGCNKMTLTSTVSS